MKTVLLVRHAKSSWDNLFISDFDRPLNDRGKKNAPEMGKRLKKMRLTIDLFLSSPAERAKKTAELFASELDYPKKQIEFIPELYHAAPPVFDQVIGQAPDSADVIALFSHNPGITDYVNQLTETRVDNMPTAAIFAVKADIEHWRDFPQAKKSFVFFDYPKSTRDD